MAELEVRAAAEECAVALLEWRVGGEGAEQSGRAEGEARRLQARRGSLRVDTCSSSSSDRE